MNSKKKIGILGGDLRQRTTAVLLGKMGYQVTLWGIDTEPAWGIRSVAEPAEAVEGAEGILLPLPASVDGTHLHCPLAPSSHPLRLQEVLTLLHSGQQLIGGRLPEVLVANAEAKGIRVTDYFQWEEFQIHNAYTTAEAALSIAMNQLNRTLRGARVAITGYGRIGKHLSHLLLQMGARVTVAARREEDRAWAESAGCQSLDLSREGAILSLASGYHVIYNTVPHWLFDRSFLEQADPETFLIDLSSVPGGIDIGCAKELGSNVLWATSLPGKYAPESAGELIAHCVDKILGEEEKK